MYSNVVYKISQPVVYGNIVYVISQPVVYSNEALKCINSWSVMLGYVCNQPASGI